MTKEKEKKGGPEENDQTGAMVSGVSGGTLIPEKEESFLLLLLSLSLACGGGGEEGGFDGETVIWFQCSHTHTWAGQAWQALSLK